MYCNQCGHPISENEENCPNCGAPADVLINDGATTKTPVSVTMSDKEKKRGRSSANEEEIYNDEDWSDSGQESDRTAESDANGLATDSDERTPDSPLIQPESDYVYYDSDKYYGGEEGELTNAPRRDEWSDESFDESYDEAKDSLFVESDSGPRRRWPAVVVTVFLVAVVGFLAFYFLRNQTSALSASEQLAKAIKVNDNQKILEILQANAPDDEASKARINEFPEINNTNLKPFFELLKDENYKSGLLTELEAKRNSDIILVPGQDTAAESLYLSGYGINLVTTAAPVTITSPVLSQPIELSVPGTTELMPLYPGEYSFSFAYPSGDNDQSVTHEIRLTWNDPNIKDGNYVLNTSSDVVQVKLADEYSDATILIDGKSIDKTVREVLDEGGILGSFAKESSIALLLKIDEDLIKSDPIILNSDNQELNFVFPDAEYANTDALDAKVYHDGVLSGLLSDYADKGFIIGKKGSGVKYEVMVDGEDVQLSATTTVTTSLDTDTPSSDGTETTVGRADDVSTSTQRSTTRSGENAVTTVATTTKAPATTTKAPVTTTKAPATTTKAPVTTTKAPVTTTTTTVGTTAKSLTDYYTSAEIENAKNGKLSDKMKQDILASIGSFVRQDAVAIKDYNINEYTTLANPQLGRHRDWLEELKASKTAHTFMPVQSAIWNPSWHSSYASDGLIYARVTQTYYYNITTVKDGVTIRTNEAHGDNWTHKLYFDVSRGKWMIYDNAEVSGDCDDVDRYGY